MQKIISLFQRNYDTDKLFRNEVVPDAEWVIAGEGIATRKYNGTCCLIRGGKLYKRHEIKSGGKVPEHFEAASAVDPVTGKQQGWLPVGDGPEDRWHREAWELLTLHDIHGKPIHNAMPTYFQDATYELIGPKIQGNPEHYDHHTLIQHGVYILRNVPIDFDGLKSFFATCLFEGIVWHHPDGRMVKIKRRDFWK